MGFVLFALVGVVRQLGETCAVGFFKRKPKVHAVALYDTRPLADDPKPFDPYFVAICELSQFLPVFARSDNRS
jgi:hypothetical protein